MVQAIGGSDAATSQTLPVVVESMVTTGWVLRYGVAAQESVAYLEAEAEVVSRIMRRHRWP